MKLTIALVVTVFAVFVHSKGNCDYKCPENLSQTVCGKNGKEYKTFCHLQLEACLEDKEIGFACDGKCPCDPEEVMKMDEETVKKIQDARSIFQLKKHATDEVTDFVTTHLLTENQLKQHIAKKLVKESQAETCKSSEMAELPARLIDWFHVLKVNEKVQEMKDQRIEQEPVMKEESFTDEKLRSMYSALACSEQTDKEVEKAVCLKPVQWMFRHLDGNNDEHLSETELSEIEDIQNEQCIKPFLQSCDLDKDGRVELTEFCRCLCVTPPCTNVIKDVPILLLRGVPTPMHGFFVSRCDDDGFFMPEQCNARNECWCVDRNGGELTGSRTKKGSATCDSYNTKNPTTRLIPLNTVKEGGSK